MNYDSLEVSHSLEDLKKAIVEGDPDLAEELAKNALNSGVSSLQAINDDVIPGILEAGELWKQGEYFIPDVIMSAEAFKAAMAVLEKNQAGVSQETKGKFLICTVEGDIHDLGKSIVVTMLKASGFEVIDLGVDVSIPTFIEKVKEQRPNIVGLGAYMSTTAATMRNYIQALVDEGLRNSVKVMIGGVRTSEQYAKELGADSWGLDGVDTAEKASKLLEVQK
jgi:corrinoid protein of di/trimethylamine methyltransferase